MGKSGFPVFMGKSEALATPNLHLRRALGNLTSQPPFLLVIWSVGPGDPLLCLRLPSANSRGHLGLCLGDDCRAESSGLPRLLNDSPSLGGGLALRRGEGAVSTCMSFRSHRDLGLEGCGRSEQSPGFWKEPL